MVTKAVCSLPPHQLAVTFHPRPLTNSSGSAFLVQLGFHDTPVLSGRLKPNYASHSAALSSSQSSPGPPGQLPLPSLSKRCLCILSEAVNPSHGEAGNTSVSTKLPPTFQNRRCSALFQVLAERSWSPSSNYWPACLQEPGLL